MKYIPVLLNAALFCMLAFVLMAFGLPARAAAPVTPTNQPTATPQAACNTSRTIQVSGSAVVNVVPDRALVTLGVESNGLTPRLVQMANTVNTQRTILALNAIGIQSRDIATDNYVITPVYKDYN